MAPAPNWATRSRWAPPRPSWDKAAAKRNPLLVGSVKANIGHLEAAGGISGLIKVVLSMQHGVIPRQLHFDQPSPHIAWDRIPVKMVTEPTPWPNRDKRTASVSALGMSGTNAHVVLESTVERPSGSNETSSHARTTYWCSAGKRLQVSTESRNNTAIGSRNRPTSIWRRLPHRGGRPQTLGTSRRGRVGFGRTGAESATRTRTGRKRTWIDAGSGPQVAETCLAVQRRRIRVPRHG